MDTPLTRVELKLCKKTVSIISLNVGLFYPLKIFKFLNGELKIESNQRKVTFLFLIMHEST